MSKPMDIPRTDWQGEPATKPGPKTSIILGAAQIDTARLMTLKAAVKLEATGMRHSSGRSMRKVACRDLGLRLNTCADDVIGALNREIDRRLKAAQETAT